jgi:dephospho-CoA kinase
MKQNSTRIIGITGGIATGKSTVSNIIKKLGYKVIDADIIAREVVQKGKPAYEEIVKYFGNTIIDEFGNINRKKLGNIVFVDEKKREKLNCITHPYIMEAIKQSIYDNINEKIIFLDIPLLIETMDKLKDYDIHLDEIWLVYVDEESQIQRLMARDNISRNEALNKIRAQMPMEMKKKYATVVIDNRGSVEELQKQVKNLIDRTIKNLEG